MSWEKFYRKNKADLHVHTTASDGKYLPREIVKIAWEKGVSFLAITDHDTITGLEEAYQECRKYRVAFYPGIELSTNYGKWEIHLLGYNLNWTSQELRETLAQLQEARKTRVKKMVSKLSEGGIPIKLEDVRKKALGQSMGRPHIALALRDLGMVKSIDEAMHLYLSPGCPAYVPRDRITPLAALKIIHKAGGIPVLAHPGLECPAELIPILIKNGLRGIEVFHPKHTKKQEEFYAQIAQANQLLMTGGSDFHGHEEKDFFNLGEMKVPLKSINQLKYQSIKEEF